MSWGSVILLVMIVVPMLLALTVFFELTGLTGEWGIVHHAVLYSLVGYAIVLRDRVVRLELALKEVAR